jgi:hypothetical protein
MRDDTIDAYLRGATRDRVLVGWYAYGPEEARRWVINPGIGLSRTMDRSESERYVEGLWADGVVPAWRS